MNKTINHTLLAATTFFLSFTTGIAAENPHKNYSVKVYQAQEKTLKVVEQYPVDNARNVDLNKPIEITFNAPIIKPEENNIVLLSENKINYRINLVNKNKLQIIPLEDLNPDSEYSLIIKKIKSEQPVSGYINGKRINNVPLMDKKSIKINFKTKTIPKNEGVINTQSKFIKASYNFSDNRNYNINALPIKSKLENGYWTPGQNNINGNWFVFSKGIEEPDYTNYLKKYKNTNTAIVGRVLDISGRPVGKISVSIFDKKNKSRLNKVKTNNHGYFTLPSPVGHNMVVVEGYSINEKIYGDFSFGYTSKNGLNLLSNNLYVPKYKKSDLVSLGSPAVSTTIKPSSIPGLEIKIPEGTVLKDLFGKVVDKIAIVPVPMDRTPSPIDKDFPVYFSIQPEGLSIQNNKKSKIGISGIQTIYPNYFENDKVIRNGYKREWSFLNYVPTEGWKKYGKGTLSKDLSQVVPDNNTFAYLSSGASFSFMPENPITDTPDCGGCTVAKPVDVFSGMMWHDFNDVYIDDIIPIVFTRKYVTTQLSLQDSFGQNMLSNYSLRLNVDTQTDGLVRCDTVYLELPNRSQIRFSRTAPAGNAACSGEWKNFDTGGDFGGAVLASVDRYFGFDGYTHTFQITKIDGMKYFFNGSNANYLKGIEDVNGNLLTIKRSGKLITKITSPHGRELNFEYNNDLLVSLTDDLGRIITYNYQGNLLTQVNYPDNTHENYDYQGGLMRQAWDRNGNLIFRNTYINDASYEIFNDSPKYISNDRVAVQENADGGKHYFNYRNDTCLNPNFISVSTTRREYIVRPSQPMAPPPPIPFIANCVFTKDPQGVVTKHTFNDDGSNTKLEIGFGTPLAQTSTFSRDGTNRITGSIDQIGRKTSSTYDASLNRMISRTFLADSAEAITYYTQYGRVNGEVRLLSTTDPLNRTTYYSYDNNGNLTSIKKPKGNTTTIQYNDVNTALPTKVTMPTGEFMSTQYLADKPISMSNSVGDTTQIFYDKLGRVITQKDPLGNQDLITRDVMGRMTKYTDVMGRNSSYEYDNNGQVTKFLDNKNNQIKFNYNNMNWVSSQEDQLGLASSFIYNKIGQPISYKDRKNQTSAMTYDALNRLKTITYADNSVTTYTYDDVNRVTNIVDTQKGSIVFVYDGLDRVVELRNSVSTTQTATNIHTMKYEYDKASRLLKSTSAAPNVTGSIVITYQYDDNDNVISISQNNGNNISNTMTFEYDLSDRRKIVNYSNGIIANYSYDMAGRLSSIVWKNQSNQILDDLYYTYSPRGEIKSITGTLAPEKLETASNTPKTFNSKNQLKQFNGAVLVYDNNGNLTDDGTNLYAWNARDELINIKQKSNGTTLATFTYDLMGRRVSKTVNNDTINYHYNGQDVLLSTSLNNTQYKKYFNGLMIDEKFSIEKNSSLANTNPEQYYFMQDQVMSIKSARKTTQEKVGIYDYSAYGEKVVAVNNPVTSNIPVVGGVLNSLLGTILPPATIPQTLQSNPEEEFGYTGREENNGVDGLMYYRNRYYSNKFKSFISEDPIGLAGGMNQYGYVNGNPVSYNDPMGLYGISDFQSDSADLLVGIGDGASLGITKYIRTQNNIGGSYCSGAYSAGQLLGAGIGTYLYGKALLPSKYLHYTKSEVMAQSILQTGLRRQIGLFGNAGYLTKLGAFGKNISPFTTHTGNYAVEITGGSIIRIFPQLNYLHNATKTTEIGIFATGMGVNESINSLINIQW